MQSFSAAPWSTALNVMSVLGTVVLLCAAGFMFRDFPASIGHGTFRIVFPLIMLGVTVGSLLFIVAGFELDSHELRVKRLFWSTRIPLSSLKSAWHDSNAAKGSIRLFGNGGLYSFTGVFKNSRLGRYRAFMTNPSCAVVLKQEGKTTVVTPADPEAFLAHLKLIYPNVQIGKQTDA